MSVFKGIGFRRRWFPASFTGGHLASVFLERAGEVHFNKMPDFCAAYGCSNSRSIKTKTSGITFHRFPKTRERRTQWEVAVRRKGFVATDRTVLCSDHFKSEDFDRTGQTVRIKDGVVPTLFNFPSHLQKEVTTKGSRTSRRVKDDPATNLSPDETQSDVQQGASAEKQKQQDTDPPPPLPALLKAKRNEALARKFKVKMLENSVFYSEVQIVLKTLVETTVDVVRGSGKRKKPTSDRGTDFDSMVDLLAREATRTIDSVFSQLHLPVLTENASLKTQLGRLEVELEGITESLKNAELWRENVLSGCPVLFQESGLVFTLKPLGKLTTKTNLASEGADQTSPAACQEQDSAQDLSPSNTLKLQNSRESVVRTTGKVFVCEVCEKSFNRQLHLTKHMKTHREQKPFACDQCPRKFSNANAFEFHLLQHEEKKYATFRCQLCEKTFKTKMSLKTHQLVHTDVRPFSCSACGKAFKTKHNLRSHRTVHLIEKPHKCSDCGESFRHAISLQCHRSVHTGEHPYQCQVCGKTLRGRRSLQTHQAVHRGKLFTCETCGAGFTLRQNLRRHFRIHTGETPLACKVCGKRFMQDNKLKAHLLLHGATKAFMCDLCGKTFLYNCQLQKHQKVSHDENRGFRKRTLERRDRRVIYRRDKTIVNVTPFSCSSCHKGFDSAASLKKHELIHTGDMKHTCSECGRSFFHKATYQYHLRVHSGERPFVCEVCGERFIVRQALVSHSLQHSGEKPHKCEQCGKTFRIYTNYQRHLRVHTGEKPYECEVCGVRFRQLGHVKFHMQVHTGERPHTCSNCGLGFSDSRLLKKHECSEEYDKASGSKEF